MNVKVFFETLIELYAKQNNVKVKSIEIKEACAPRN